MAVATMEDAWPGPRCAFLVGAQPCDICGSAEMSGGWSGTCSSGVPPQQQQLTRDLEGGTTLKKDAPDAPGKCIDCAERGAAASAGRCCGGISRLRRPLAQTMDASPRQATTHPEKTNMGMIEGLTSFWSTPWDDRCTLNCLS